MKYPDWRLRLTNYIGASAREPFEVGKHDCALFWAGAVEAMTGVDHAASYRGQYKTFKAGRELIGGDLAAHVGSIFEEVPPALAQVGDLVMIKDACGVVQGEHIYVLGRGGVSTTPLTRATKAFRVI